MQRSQCGWSDSSVLVCCPDKLTSTTQSPPVRGSLLPAPGICGINPIDERIIGGVPTEVDEFPWMALLQYSKRMILFFFLI